MRTTLVLLTAFVGVIVSSCNSSKTTNTAKTFCDTSCFKDSLRFDGNSALKPYLVITGTSCKADTISWSYKGMGINRKTSIADIIGRDIVLNKDYVRCYIKDTAYANLIFNDCLSGRGYWLKLPFNKTANIGRKSGALNNFDRKFVIPDNLVAYTDRGNLFVEDLATGKNAMMTFGEDTGLDFDAIHETIDSINVSPTKIWARVKLGGKWTDLEQNIVIK